jgi:hypothetical protein
MRMISGNVIKARLFALTLLLLAGCSVAPTIPRALNNEAQQIAPERLIVIAVDNHSTPLHLPGSTTRSYGGLSGYAVGSQARADVLTLSHDYHLRKIDEWPIAPLHMHCIVFEIPAEASRELLLTQLAADPRVKLAQPLQTFSTTSDPAVTTTYNDPYVGLQQGFRQIDVEDAHRWSKGDNVKVAIIDTGVDTSHPDLQKQVLLTQNFVDADATRFVQDRHGTEIAGVIAAVANNHEGIVGVAPRVHLIALKACWQLHTDNDAAHCNSFTLAQALVAAMDANAQIVNLSIAGPADKLLSALLEQGIRRGIIFVGAVAPDAAYQGGFPAGVRGVIAVDSLDAPHPLAQVLLAPGHEILTLLPGRRYDFASGSSLATAHVTGTVALLLAENHQLSRDTIVDLLARTAVTVSTDDGAAASINACAALASLLGRAGCATTGKRIATLSSATN